MVRTMKIEETRRAGTEAPTALYERVTIPVTGMTCAACQSFIQQTLGAQGGVQDANVNLIDRKSVV